MTLKEYLDSLPIGDEQKFAISLGVHKTYLSNLKSTRFPTSPKISVKIEELTQGAVTRRDLRPDDYWEIWPDLARDV